LHGELIVAFSPQAFAAGRSGDPFARAEALFDAILGQGARLPSQRRFLARMKSEIEGITLSPAELEQLDRFLDQGIGAV
jgi:LDH2 family malate/lactate/ureidoglycolate dehydrogenase